MTWAAVARKDLVEEARSREALAPLLLVGLGVVATGLIAFHDHEGSGATTAGVLWMGLSLAAATTLARAFAAERDRGTLDALLALPLDRGQLFLGKAAASWALLALAAAVLAPALLVAQGEAPGNVGALVLLLALGTLGLAATGTMLSALAAHARARDALLPVLLLPLLVPVLVAGVHGTMDALAGAPFAEWRPEALVLAGYDVAFLAASYLLFDEVVGA